MRLIQISAKNYRTLVDVEIDFSADYCTISGQNNAGKSSLVRLISMLLEARNARPWIAEEYHLNYEEDVTQWLKEEEPILVGFSLCISRNDDPELVTFIEKQAETTIADSEARLNIEFELTSASDMQTKVFLDGAPVEELAAKEIVTKLRGSESLFLHNSTNTDRDLYYGRGRFNSFFEVLLSGNEQKQIRNAQKSVQSKIKRLAREHRDELNSMLGKLNDKYDVEFSSVSGYQFQRMPLSINLNDKNVKVPLGDWGSGTQNRTLILMSILQANRIKTRASADDRITPIVVIEEPESFLHPSAQAEFGNLLQQMSTELGIQIIACTHSPYMLNQLVPSANILLERKLYRKKLKETSVTDTSGENWMAPYADHLGVVPPEFEAWRDLFGTPFNKVVLVEGEIDKEYLQHLRENHNEEFSIADEIEIIPYGGKDTLKNTALLRFFLGKFKDAFITFDLDARKDVLRSLEGLGLKENTDFLAIGENKSGRDSIEGLLPDSVTSAVYGRETDLVMQLGSSVSGERRSAKSQLKRRLLEEFKANSGYSESDLKGYSAIAKAIRNRLQR